MYFLAAALEQKYISRNEFKNQAKSQYSKICLR
jgi:hypothetical protein